jgi:hypothetical protein
MSQDSAVFDLGDLDRAASDPSSSTATSSRVDRRAGPREVRHGAPASIAAVRSWSGTDLGQSLSIVLPGSGQIVRGDVSVGLFFLASLGFVAAMAWAVTPSISISGRSPT